MSEVTLGAAQPKRRSDRTCSCGAPNETSVIHSYTGQPCYVPEVEPPQGRSFAAEAVDTRAFEMTEPSLPDPSPENPGNPYAPTGWGKKNRTEFDVNLPSGQLCRVMRLERDDLLRLNLIEYLDTFTPLLMDQSMSDAQRESSMEQMVKDNPESLGKLFKAVDRVAMAASVKPKIVEDESKANYGNESDWINPNFVPVAFIDDIDTIDRMVIFAAAFGRSMDDLKSVFREAESMDGLANEPGIQQNSQ